MQVDSTRIVTNTGQDVSDQHADHPDHRALIKSLSAEQRRALTAKSNLAGFAGVSLHWGAIAMVASLIMNRVPLWPLLLPVQGVLIVFLFTMMHECVHRTVFATKYLNDVVATVCSFALGLPREWFRQFHLEHHRHTQNIDKDPELQSDKPQTTKEYFWHLTGIAIWKSHIGTMLRNAMGKCDDDYVPASKRALVKTESRCMLVAYFLITLISVLLGSTELLFVWIIPASLGQPFLRLYLLAEHGRCAYVANAFENTRTTFSNKLVRMLAWNMPYHAEHHAYPMVPFFRLGQFHRLTKEYLLVTERGYARFNAGYYQHLRRDDGLD